VVLAWVSRDNANQLLEELVDFHEGHSDSIQKESEKFQFVSEGLFCK
jgi:hypothetical protein